MSGAKVQTKNSRTVSIADSGERLAVSVPDIDGVVTAGGSYKVVAAIGHRINFIFGPDVVAGRHEVTIVKKTVCLGTDQGTPAPELDATIP